MQMATAMDSSVPHSIAGGVAVPADISGEAIRNSSGKIPKIVHQGWLKKKGKYKLIYSSSSVFYRWADTLNLY